MSKHKPITYKEYINNFFWSDSKHCFIYTDNEMKLFYKEYLQYYKNVYKE